MIKVTTNAYVFKFVGGEKGMTRLCHYCRKNKTGGMICIYGNGPDDTEDAIFVCPSCAKKGCKESESQWASLNRRVAGHR